LARDALHVAEPALALALVRPPMNGLFATHFCGVKECICVANAAFAEARISRPICGLLRSDDG
jgi:hypothetical protein